MPAFPYSTPTTTFCATVRSANERASWKVRAMPRRQTRSGERPTSDWPRKLRRPASGRQKPAMQLNRVVLPEPFGPISPTISPSRTAKSTPSTATRPPKRLVTPLPSSTIIPLLLSTPLPARPAALDEAHHAARRDQHHHEQ